MGIRLNTNTWRAPLQLIDCWLPAPSSHAPVKRAMPPFLQRFARAGWLKPAGATNHPPEACPSSTARHLTNVPVRAQHVRVHSGPELSRASTACGGRLALSGRIGDVCAELDRLAALEHPATHRRAASM
jgi:hypothetical protein